MHDNIVGMQDIEENQSERNQKYRELRKREETMDTFLASFDDQQAEEMRRINDLQIEVPMAMNYSLLGMQQYVTCSMY